MKHKINAIIIITALTILLTASQVYAGSISLSDDSFGDWSDKPGYSDPIKDESQENDITTVKWYPDTSDGYLYIYCERAAGDDTDDKGKRFEDWILNIRFSSDTGVRQANIKYHPPSNQVDVDLYDDSGNYLWGEKGKWGDSKIPGKGMEFRIPLSYLAGSITAGYQIDMYFTSGKDRAPDSDAIKISTVSTYPVATTIGVLAVTVLGFFIIKRRYNGKGLKSC